MPQAHTVSGGVLQREVPRSEVRRDTAHRELESYAIPARTKARMASMVCEGPAPYGDYESEGSECRSLASLRVSRDARWTATITVPIPPRAVAFIEVERRGELPAGYRGAEERALLSVPIAETGALIELLTGVVAQARRDGVLPVE